MIYKSAQHWHDHPHKKVLLFGMSGLGKTHVSNMLRASGDWFHHSIDYRIGSHYLGEQITNQSRSGKSRSEFSFENLEPLATFLGKPGDPAKGGIEIGEYMRRQKLHEQAEIAALLEADRFIRRGGGSGACKHFVCDSGGSICEVVQPDNMNDPVLRKLSEHLLMVWIKGSQDHNAELIARFDRAPKPMCYRAEFLQPWWADYLNKNNIKPAEVDPDDFVRAAYGQALSHRQPRYCAMARNWGVTVSAKDVANVTTPQDFEVMIADALEKPRH